MKKNKIVSMISDLIADFGKESNKIAVDNADLVYENNVLTKGNLKLSKALYEKEDNFDKLKIVNSMLLEETKNQKSFIGELKLKNSMLEKTIENRDQKIEKMSFQIVCKNKVVLFHEELMRDFNHSYEEKYKIQLGTWEKTERDYKKKIDALYDEIKGINRKKVLIKTEHVMGRESGFHRC